MDKVNATRDDENATQEHSIFQRTEKDKRKAFKIRGLRQIEANLTREWRKESRANRGTQKLDFSVRVNASYKNGI